MNNTQKILIGVALAATAGLYYFGSTVGPKKAGAQPQAQAADSSHNHDPLDLEKVRAGAMSQLNQAQQQYINTLENTVTRGDVKSQQAAAHRSLASFWKDSVASPVMHFKHLSLASELDNTEKSLTFAAHSILGYLPYAHNHLEQEWLANRGKELFDKAFAMNESNDSTIVGIGGTIMYGAKSAEGPMAGIMKVRAVVEKDSTNMFAQYMLGIGGVISGQYDKAAQRFEKVAKAQPDNLEVWFKLAEAYELSNMNPQAISTYEQIEQKVSVPEMKTEIKKRITQLKSAAPGK